MQYLNNFIYEDISIQLHKRENYIIGENLIGKSYILSQMFKQFKENNEEFALYFNFSHVLFMKNFSITDRVKKLSSFFPHIKFSNHDFINIYSRRVSFDSIPISLNNIISLVYSIDVNFGDGPGLVFIDDYGESLSPSYQYYLIDFLRQEFPLVQFIIATNNINSIQGASESSNIFALHREVENNSLSMYLLNDLSEFTLNKLATCGIYDLNTCTMKKFDRSISGAMSSDDYVYSLIHKKIRERISSMPPVDEEHILKLIDEELDKI